MDVTTGLRPLDIDLVESDETPPVKLCKSCRRIKYKNQFRTVSAGRRFFTVYADNCKTCENPSPRRVGTMRINARDMLAAEDWRDYGLSLT